MKNLVLLLSLLGLSISVSAQEIKGPVPTINTEFVIVSVDSQAEGKRYELKNGRSLDLKTTDNKTTQCWIKQPMVLRIPCRDLADVGHISEARLTVDGSQVLKIEVLDMKQ